MQASSVVIVRGSADCTSSQDSGEAIVWPQDRADGRAVARGRLLFQRLSAGAEALPINGPTWQVMRLSRNRNWGHPQLIHFLENLSAKADKTGTWPGLLVGDIRNRGALR
jgi:murein endopeptidase